MRCYFHLCCIPGCLDGGEPSIHSDPLSQTWSKPHEERFH
uniref:Uncharacterized protein n=1 Tax=Anguilla anguilla TaxID=7936 RepID=A0A0E9SNL5_ANGAN